MMTPVVITFAAWMMFSVDLTVPALSSPRKVAEKPIQFHRRNRSSDTQNRRKADGSFPAAAASMSHRAASMREAWQDP